MNTRARAETRRRDHATLTHGLGEEQRVIMTLRVSRDSGRTWGPRTEVSLAKGPVVPISPFRFPPCACPPCARQQRDSTRPLRMVP